jgi:hypothetical protein
MIALAGDEAGTAASATAAAPIFSETSKLPGLVSARGSGLVVFEAGFVTPAQKAGRCLGPVAFDVPHGSPKTEHFKYTAPEGESILGDCGIEAALIGGAPGSYISGVRSSA